MRHDDLIDELRSLRRRDQRTSEQNRGLLGCVLVLVLFVALLVGLLYMIAISNRPGV